jgi:octopine/nopaline transport system ATP-binding protein
MQMRKVQAMTAAAALSATRTLMPEAVRIDNLHKKFGPLEVIKGVSLSANEGDVIAIIGGSGSGKSTLLRCINFLETPTSGSISICGEQVKCKSDGKGGSIPSDRRQLERIRTSLGMVFQSFNLWQHMTVIQNVVEVPIHVLGQTKDAAYANAETLLKRVGLWEKRDVYPSFMSGGQQQRAAIARALAIKRSCSSTNRHRRSIRNWSAKC